MEILGLKLYFMKRYVITMALTCLLIFSSFSISKPVYAVVMIPIVVEVTLNRFGKKIIRLVLTHAGTWIIEQVFENNQWVDRNKSSLANSNIIIIFDKDVWDIKENGMSIGKGKKTEDPSVKKTTEKVSTYECEVKCDACTIIKHPRNLLVYAKKLQDAENKAKDEYIAYFTKNKTTSDIMERHNKHDHLKATCEKIKGSE